MKFYPTYLQSLGILAIFLLNIAASSLLIFRFFSLEVGPGSPLVYFISMALTLTVTLYLRKDDTFAITEFPSGIIIIGAITLLSMHVFVDPLVSLAPVSDSIKRIAEASIQHPVSFFLTAVLAAPVFEELIFRGVILSGLLKNYHPYKAIGYSALLFGLIHGNFAQGIGAFIIGLVIGWIYWKTESVIPGILLHLINNLVGFVGIMFTSKEDTFKSLSEQLGNPLVYWLLVIASGIVSVLGIWLLHKIYFKNARVYPEMIK